jgi:hypothetical protein
MIESLMLLGIGVCAGCLLVLAFIPLVHRRATRLTTRHMDDATPLAIKVIQADKDRLRAEFATSVRRLEVSVEEMRTKSTGHLGEIGRQKMEIQRLRLEFDKKMALVFALRYRTRYARASCGGWRNWCSTHSSVRSAGLGVDCSACCKSARWRTPAARTWPAVRPESNSSGA